MSSTAVCAQEIVSLPALPTFADIIFLSDFDGPDYATTAIDRSPKAATITFFGTTHLDILVKKFGTSSLALPNDSVQKGVRLPVDSGYNILPGDFTVEGYVYSAAFAPDAVIAGVFGGGLNFNESQWVVYYDDTDLIFQICDEAGANILSAPHGMIEGQFYYVTVCRCSTTIRFFIDGILIGKAECFARDTTPPKISAIGMSIGSDWDGTWTTYQVLGWVDSVRVTKKAWYRTDDNFTPPAGPFGYIQPSLYVDQDTFYNARTTPYTIAPNRYIDTDVINPPGVSPQRLSPSLFVDSDTIYAPAVHEAITWDTSFSVAAITGLGLIATNNHTTALTNGAFGTATQFRNSGLVYWEVTCTSVGGAHYSVGVATGGPFLQNIAINGQSGCVWRADGHVLAIFSDLGAIMPVLSTGDVIGIAVHRGRNLVWFKRVSGTPSNWNNDPTASPETMIGGITIPDGYMLPVCTFGDVGGSASDVITLNAGQSAFVGVLPSGYERGFVGTGA